MRGAHTDTVSANTPQELAVRHGLVAGPTNSSVHTLFDVNVGLARALIEHLTEILLIDIVDRREARTESLVVGPAQRMLQGQNRQTQMVLDDHDVAHLKRRIEAARSVGQHHHLDAENFEDLYGQCAQGH